MNIVEKTWRSFGTLDDLLSVSSIFPDRQNKVIAYHSVGGTGSKKISIQGFRKQIEYILSNYEIVDLDEVLSTDEKCISLTFDDGYVDFYNNVVPILIEFSLPATVFVITSKVGDEGYLNWNELNHLSKSDLVTIGNHTHSHPDLIDVETENLYEEIVSSKTALENRLNINISRFCYPFNKFDERSIEVVSDYYALAVCDGGFKQHITSTCDPFRIPRIDGSNNLEQVKFELTDFSTYIGKFGNRVIKY